MNATLAALYGTGLEKTASEGEEELDLHSISAADFLDALQEIESEKVAEDGEIDLSDLTDEELVSLYNEMQSEDTIEKMASSGELEYWDMAGRVMAHAYAEELDKTASEYQEEDFDLNEFSVEELIELGQELEKEAGLRGMMARRAGRKAAKATAAAEDTVRRGMAGSATAKRGAALRERLEAAGMGARVKKYSDVELGQMASRGGMGAAAAAMGTAGGMMGGR